MFRFHSFKLRGRSVLAVFVVLCCAGFATPDASAAGASVTAVLSNSNTAVGEPVQLQVKVTGSTNVKHPGAIAVDGLDIRFTGQSQLLEGRNFQFSYSYIYNYTVMPVKAGTFKIPPQTIDAGGTPLRTPELTLQVIDSGTAQTPKSKSSSSIDPSKIAFVELTLSKTSAYVGEMIPAVVRIGINVRTPVESLGNLPEIAGQGFTAQKMREPRQTIETINGKTYQIFTFKTALSPAKSGKIEVGPVQVNAVVRIPRQPPRNNQMPRDLFDMNDPFMDNFFRTDPFFTPSTPQEMKLKSEATVLEVKSLPPGAPAEFGGAVGSFTLASDAKPKKAQVGDPLTVTATIAGRGNFDRVTAPTLEDEKGWHKYPPSAEFKQDDDVGISGTKTFETVLSANERKDKIPAQLFTFFDPAKEQYVTLRADPIGVRVDGGTIAGTTPAPASQPPSSAPAPTQEPKAGTQQQILHQLADWPGRNQSFTPLFARRSFWLAQLVPLLALLGFGAWKIRARHLNNREALRREALQQEAAALHRSLRRDDVSPEEYFSRASRAVQIKTALLRDLDPNLVDAEMAAAAFGLDEVTRSRLRQLFEKSDEARYSGGQNGIRLLPSETRHEVLELIDTLRP
ncbi:MAG TPA: BatD family protein [Chthoniobacterales bacterium]|nr:BatD family protein [Chthoniobacterales bacterium]